MASQMLDKILEAENAAKKKKEECEKEAKSLISNAEKDAAELVKKAKADAEAEAKTKITQAELKAAALIEEKRQEAFAECDKFSALLSAKSDECNAVIIKKIIV